MTDPRRLDALLAEHLFGKKPEVVEPGTPYAGVLALLGEPPRYSSTWEGLGLVALALRAKGWDLRVYIVADTKGVDAHVHRTGEEKFYERGPHASATDAPEAVALAALKALGVEA